MEHVIVRHLEPEVRAELMHRAALHGWSMEEEVLQILRSAVSQPAPLRLGSRIAQRFAGVGLIDPLPELHQPVNRPQGFDK